MSEDKAQKVVLENSKLKDAMAVDGKDNERVKSENAKLK
jgi:hypothetical protein